MIRYLLISLLILPAFAHSGVFYFPGSNRPYPAQSEDDEEVELDDSWRQQVRRPSPTPARPAARPAPRPVARPSYSDDERAPEGRLPCRNCSTGRPAARPLPTGDRILSTAANMRAPVWATFARNFAACAPGCQPARLGIHRPHDGSTSCHHVDRAIDVGAMVCDGRTYEALNGGRFSQMVACMRPRMRTLYQQSYKLSGRRVTRALLTDAHYDHAHFSIGCYGNFW